MPAIRASLWVVALAIAAGCGSNGSVDEALANAQPHLVTFARFERWVRQARSSNVGMRGRGALSEATFAPLRREPNVLAAFVVDALPGSSSTTALAMPESSVLPAALPWVVIRDAELGALRVAVVQRCPIVTRTANESPSPRACVFVEKESKANGAVLVVTVAFERVRAAD